MTLPDWRLRPFADATNAMVAYHEGYREDGWIAGFSADGTQIAKHVRLGLAQDLPASYVDTVLGAAAIGPLDYLVIYRVTTPWGLFTRAARVHLTPR